MNRHRAETIARHRLRDWAKVLERLTATPVLMLSVSHAPETQGQVVLNTTQDMPPEVLAGFLRHTLAELEKPEEGEAS